MHIRLLTFWVIFMAPIVANAQSNDQSRELIRQYCPLSASNPQLQEDFIQFYIIADLNLMQDLDSAFISITNARQHLKTKADSAAFYFCNGYYQVRKSNYKEAQSFYTQSGLLFQQLKDIKGTAYVDVHLANIDYYMKKTRPAYNAYVSVMNAPSTDDFLKSKLHHNVGCLIMELSADSLNSSDPKMIIPVIKKINLHLEYAIQRFKNLGYLSGLAATYSVYINQKLREDKVDEALALADSSAVIARQLKDDSRLAFIQIKKSTILIRLEKYQAAVDTAQLAATYFKSVDNLRQAIHAKSAVYTAQMDGGMYKAAAITGHELYKDSRNHIDEELADAHGRYAEEFENEKNQLLIKEQESLLERDRLIISNRNRLLTATVFGSLAIGSFMLFLFQRKKREADQEMNALQISSKQKEIKSIIQAQEQERQRIAKDLHDGIVQQLGGLKMGLQKIFMDDTDVESEGLMTVLDQSTQELRELSHRMMPRALSELGLVPALEDMLDNSIGHTEIQYEFEQYGISERLPESIEITLYRISQELINNVIKHSGATKVNIQLIRSKEDIILIIEDNGRGFESSNTKDGIGLMNISSRLDTVNGHVNYERSADSGTLATIRIPLNS